MGEIVAAPYAFATPLALGPVVVVVTRSNPGLASITAVSKSIEPPSVPIAPLPGERAVFGLTVIDPATDPEPMRVDPTLLRTTGTTKRFLLSGAPPPTTVRVGVAALVKVFAES